MRRQFKLPASDVTALNAMKVNWECVIDPKGHCVLLHLRPLPEGFDISHTDLALLLPVMYPDAQIDSVYFSRCPRPLGRPTLAAISEQPIDGKTWYRLCRHRTSENPWRPGVDDIAAHLALVDQWLLQSLRRD